jgi:hypothetical protein
MPATSGRTQTWESDDSQITGEKPARYLHGDYSLSRLPFWGVFLRSSTASAPIKKSVQKFTENFPYFISSWADVKT